MLKTLSLVMVVMNIAVLVEVEAQRGWMPISKDAPAVDRVFDERYKEAGNAALEHLNRARIEIGTPALTAAVGIHGKLVWAGAVGYAKMEDDVAATLDTKFRIGSTSKGLTSTGLALLVDRGLIDLDRPIGEFVPNLPNAKWKVFTPRQLASHTSGLPGYDENTDQDGVRQTILLDKQYDDVFDALAIFDGSELLFEPGTDFHYSSFDVNLLSAVMQTAAKQPYLEYMHETVFEPLGMTNTHADYQDRPVENRATFYMARRNTVKVWKDANLSQKWASGGFVSTSSDLVRLGMSYFDEDFIDPKTVEKFWTQQRLKNGEINVQKYAIGWRSYPTDRFGDEGQSTHAIHHGGVSKGAMSWLVIYPEFEMVVAINMNTRAQVFSDFANQETAISEGFLAAMERLGLLH